MNDLENMLPCPFCGSPARWIDKSEWDYGSCHRRAKDIGDVGCSNENCYLFGGADYESPKSEAIKRWNKRKII